MPSEMSQSLRQSWMPSDWNNGTGCRFYDPMLVQRDIILRLLMHGVNFGGQADIPADRVFGQAEDGLTGKMTVGLGDMRMPPPSL